MTSVQSIGVRIKSAALAAAKTQVTRYNVAPFSLCLRPGFSEGLG